jgi:hypothetical protein
MDGARSPAAVAAGASASAAGRCEATAHDSLDARARKIAAAATHLKGLRISASPRLRES